jgi:hypothetical protein
MGIERFPGPPDDTKEQEKIQEDSHVPEQREE